MKKFILFIISLTSTLILYSQTQCDNFNSFQISSWADNSTCDNLTVLDNWKSKMAEIKYENFASQGGASDSYLKIRDNPSSTCSSWIFNSDDYNGDWSNKTQCLCYDFNFFSNGGGANNPPTLLQIYSGAFDPFNSTYVAEFVLYSPVTQADGWVTICPPLKSDNYGLPANSLGYWQMTTPMGGGVTDWNNLISNVSGIAFKVDINAATELYGIDNLCFKDCPKGQEPIPNEPPFCCLGRNLIANGGFEGGNTGFVNDFMFQSTISSNSIVPGQYGVISGAEAAIISPVTWNNIQEANTCSDNSGNFLIINGENGGGAIPPSLSNSIPPKKIIWNQTVNVKDWRGYKFCFRAKNLNQCGFNIPPKINVEFSMPIGDISKTIIAPSGECDWFEITKSFNLWGYGNNLNIKITLDQGEFGDGNDIAIDDISLTQLEECPAETAEFDYETITPHPTNSQGYSVIATADILAPCEAVWWEVCKINTSTADCETGSKLNEVWWSFSTDFQGYVGTATQSGTNPGIFEYGKFYRIVRGTWGECNSWKASSAFFMKPSPNARIIKYTEQQFKKKMKKATIKKKNSKKRN